MSITVKVFHAKDDDLLLESLNERSSACVVTVYTAATSRHLLGDTFLEPILKADSVGTVKAKDR